MEKVEGRGSNETSHFDSTGRENGRKKGKPGLKKLTY